MSLPRSAADKALDVNRLGRELWSLPEAPRPIEPLPTARSGPSGRRVASSPGGSPP